MKNQGQFHLSLRSRPLRRMDVPRKHSALEAGGSARKSASPRVSMDLDREPGSRGERYRVGSTVI